jgi:dihydrofolate reductase
MRVVVINHVTLDGVMQGPGRPDEDTRGGFTAGGWAAGRSDQGPMVEAVGERMGAPGGAMLLGRRSYEGMLGHWNAQGGPFKEGLNAATKYVASSDPGTALEWPNSTLLHGDVPAAVADLREQPGGNLVVMGSGELIRSLLPHGLVDEFLLMIHPLVLGSGRRLFEPDDHAFELQLVDSLTTPAGVIIATYRSPAHAGGEPAL